MCDQDMDPHAPGWWDVLADTPAAIEQARIAAGEPWTVSALAGLQYYEWQQDDGMEGRHEPQPGDRLQLVREPDNPYDANAVAVEWRNGVRLGHLARGVAAEVAEALDRGAALRAYVLSTRDEEKDSCHYARRFDSRAWALRALLVGGPVSAQHGKWTSRAVGDLERHFYGEAPRAWDRTGRLLPTLARHPPTERQYQAAEAWAARARIARTHREADLAGAFALVEPAHFPLPEGAREAPPKRMRGMTFSQWTQVPVTLMTCTQLARHGLRPVGPSFADIRWWGHGRWRWHALHVVANARQVRVRTDEQRADAAAAAVLRRATARRRANEYA